MKIYRFVCGLMLGLSLCAAQASAQSASSSSTAGWQGQIVPYLWGSGINGQVGIDNRTADVDASFGNILSHLHFAAMGMADARLNKFVVLADAFYTDVRDENATPGPLFSSGILSRNCSFSRRRPATACWTTRNGRSTFSAAFGGGI